MANILLDTDSTFLDPEALETACAAALPIDNRILGGMALRPNFGKGELLLLEDRVRRVFGAIKHDRNRELDVCIAYGYGSTAQDEEIIEQRLGQTVKALKINVFPHVENTEPARVLYVGRTSLKSFKIVKYNGPVPTSSGEALDAVVYSILSLTI